MFSYLLNDPSVRWKVSTRSGGANCVEVATAVAVDTVAVRDSKDRQGPVLLYPAAAWRDFLAAARRDMFDPPIGG